MGWKSPTGRTSLRSSPQTRRWEALCCRSSWEGDHTHTLNTFTYLATHSHTYTQTPVHVHAHTHGPTHTHTHTLSHSQYTLIHKYTPHTLKTVHLKHSSPYSCVHTCTLNTLVYTPMHSHVCTLRHTCVPTPDMHSLSTLTNLICTDSHIPPWSTRLPVAAEHGSAERTHASQEGDPSTLSSADNCVLTVLGQ